MNLNQNPDAARFAALFSDLGDVLGNYALTVNQEGDVRVTPQTAEQAAALAAAGTPEQAGDAPYADDSDAALTPPDTVTVGVFEFTPDFTPAMLATEQADIEAMFEALQAFWDASTPLPDAPAADASH